MTTPHRAPQGHTPEDFEKLKEQMLAYANCVAHAYQELHDAVEFADSNDLDMTDEVDCGLHILITQRNDLLSATARQSQRIALLEGALKEMERLATSELWGTGMYKPEFLAGLKAARSALAASTLNQTEQGK